MNKKQINIVLDNNSHMNGVFGAGGTLSITIDVTDREGFYDVCLNPKWKASMAKDAVSVESFSNEYAEIQSALGSSWSDEDFWKLDEGYIYDFSDFENKTHKEIMAVRIADDTWSQHSRETSRRSSLESVVLYALDSDKISEEPMTLPEIDNVVAAIRKALIINEAI